MASSSSLKRTASSNPQGSSSDNKKQKTGSKPLDSWLAVGLPKKPHPLGVSDPLQDQDSTFLAWAAQAESPQDIQKLRNYVLEVANPDFSDEPASHAAHGAVSHLHSATSLSSDWISAESAREVICVRHRTFVLTLFSSLVHSQRILTLKSGRTGLKDEDFEVKTFREDDGESRAGMTIVDTLAHGAVDVVVVVSRWFGGAHKLFFARQPSALELSSSVAAGTMLGPRRFTDISNVALQALYRLRDAEELINLEVTLVSKDTEVHDLLVQVNRAEAKPAPPEPEPAAYDGLDIAKAKRLLVARDLRLKNLKLRLEKLQQQENEELPELPTKESASQTPLKKATDKA